MFNATLVAIFVATLSQLFPETIQVRISCQADSVKRCGLYLNAHNVQIWPIPARNLAR